jgi:hypothetical protein
LPIKRVVDDTVVGVDPYLLLLSKPSVDVKSDTGTETSREEEPDGRKASANGTIMLL